MGYHRIIGAQANERALPLMRSPASRGDGVNFVNFGYRDTGALAVTFASLSDPRLS